MGWRPTAVSPVIFLASGCAGPGVDLRNGPDLNTTTFHDRLAVTSEVGTSVRDGSFFGTQNETVAAGMETAAGVIAKKLVEHEGFCYFQTIQQRECRKEGSPR